jgi:hypothetical protein
MEVTSTGCGAAVAVVASVATGVVAAGLAPAKLRILVKRVENMLIPASIG